MILVEKYTLSLTKNFYFRDAAISAPIPVVPSTSFTSSSQVKSSILIEKRDEIVAPNIKSANCNSVSSLPTIKKNNESIQKSNQTATNKKEKVPLSQNTGKVLFTPLTPSSSFSQLVKDFLIEIRTDEELSHLQVIRNTNHELVWEIYLGYQAIAISVTPAVLAVALEDGSLHILNTVKGYRIIPPLAPPSPLSRLCASGNQVNI